MGFMLLCEICHLWTGIHLNNFFQIFPNDIYRNIATHVVIVGNFETKIFPQKTCYKSIRKKNYNFVLVRGVYRVIDVNIFYEILSKLQSRVFAEII